MKGVKHTWLIFQEELCILVYHAIEQTEQGLLLIFLLILGRKLQFIAASDERAYVTLSTSDIVKKYTPPPLYDANKKAVL